MLLAPSGSFAQVTYSSIIVLSMLPPTGVSILKQQTAGSQVAISVAALLLSLAEVPVLIMMVRY